MRTIVLAGASGLIGGLVARRLDVVALTRRKIVGLVDQRVAPVADWAAILASIHPEIVISTLGSTIRTAGSKAAFAAVDHDLVLQVARAAHDAGALQFIMVSSVGADAHASSFYLKTKGRAEDSVRALGFVRFDIMRPGLLIAERPGPVRRFERLMIALSPITNAVTPSVLDQYRGIRADAVAEAIASVAGVPEPGVFVHHNREMLARGDLAR